MRLAVGACIMMPYATMVHVKTGLKSGKISAKPFHSADVPPLVSTSTNNVVPLLASETSKSKGNIKLDIGPQILRFEHVSRTRHKKSNHVDVRP